MHTRRSGLVFGFLLLFVAASNFAGPVTGKFTANGKNFSLSYGYAALHSNPVDKKKTDVYVIVTDKDIPPSLLHDEFAYGKLPDEGITGFTLQIDDEKSINNGTLFSPAFTKHSFAAVGKQKLNLTVMTPERIAGTVSMPTDDFFGDTYEYSATFDLSIQTDAAEKPATAKGTSLPADGGEPARAWETYRKAILSGDVAAIRKSVTQDMVKGTEDPDFKKMLGFIQTMQPKEFKIRSVSTEGDTATVIVDSLDPKNWMGKIVLRRENGHWKVANEKWGSTLD